MKVLHVIPTVGLRGGGPSALVIEASGALNALGVETTVMTTDLPVTASVPTRGRVARSDLPPGADTVDIRAFPARVPRRLAYSPALARALSAELAGYDLVHIHSLYLFPQYAAQRQARRHRVPYIVTPHGALDPWLRRRGRVRKALVGLLWQRRMLERAAAIHVTTVEEGRLIASIAPRVPRVVVPNGIHWASYQSLPRPDVFRNARLAGARGPVVLTHGRLTRKKGLDILIRAFARVLDTHPTALLVVVGPDDEGLRPGLAGLASTLGAGEQTVFIGMLQGDDKLAALAAADIWALPSHTENFGIAAVEALAAGLPAVLSDAINIAPDAAKAEAALVRPPRAKDFAEAICTLLEDEGARKSLGRRAREFARRYDWTTVAPQLATAYEHVAAGVVP